LSFHENKVKFLLYVAEVPCLCGCDFAALCLMELPKYLVHNTSQNTKKLLAKVSKRRRYLRIRDDQP